jgi:hypothetical protein
LEGMPIRELFKDADALKGPKASRLGQEMRSETLLGETMYGM